jgi:hypothetical protein
VIEVRLGSTTREFECLFSLVANHRGVTAGFTVGFSAVSIRGNNTPTDNHQQHQSEYRFHGSLRKLLLSRHVVAPAA